MRVGGPGAIGSRKEVIMAKSKKSSKTRRIGHPSHIGLSQSKLEGPIRTRSGKVVYYDPGEGRYYDRSTDLYLSDKETERLHLNPAPEVAALGAGFGGYLAGPLGAGLGAYLGAKTAETEETKALEKHLKKMGKDKVDAVLEKLGVEVVKMGNNPVNLKDLKAKIAASMRGASQRFRPSRITDDELKTYAQAKARGTVGYVNLQLADPKSHARYERSLRSRMPELYNRIEASKRGKRAAWKAQDDLEMDREEVREERRAHLRDLLRDINDRPQRKKKAKKKTSKKKTAKKKTAKKKTSKRSARSNPGRLAASLVK